MRRVTFVVAALALLCPWSSRAGAAPQETCVESYGTALPMNVIAGQLVLDDLVLWNNIWGMIGRKNDGFRQCLVADGETFGWTWLKGTTDPACFAPPGQSCQFPPCMYQFSFPSLNYGVDPWGNDTGATDMPVRVGSLQSLVVTHDITSEATDDMPGSPGPIYARHSLVYDLFLTTAKPVAGQNVSATITDEVIIMLSYNPEYPDIEACSGTMNDPIEGNAVFDGFHHYDYHSFSPFNVIGRNYHQFRRIGGEVAGAPVPENVDLAPFLRYLRQRYEQPELWAGKIVIGTQLYDHTHGNVTFHSKPEFAIEQAACGDGLLGVSEQCDDGANNGTASSCCTLTCEFKPDGTASCDGNACTRSDICADGVCTAGSCAVGGPCTWCGGTCVDTGSSCECQ